MTGVPLILDADGLDALTEQPPPKRLRAHILRLASALPTVRIVARSAR